MKTIYESITERFLVQLREGTVPWRRPWLTAQNLVSRRPYRGVNALVLGFSRFDSPFWMTFRQAKDLGGTIKKGERSTPVVYYKLLEKKDEQGRPILKPNGKPKVVPLLRWANVFNLRQTEGVLAPELVTTPDTPGLERAQAIVREANLCPIAHQGFQAGYSPVFDHIVMPRPGAFRSGEDYHFTLFHEMTHATGHGSRLAREGIVEFDRFGSDRYSKEELIAELGAAFLGNDAGILDKIRFENAASYLQSWMKRLEDDPSLIVSASSQAQKAADWIRGVRLTEEEELSEAPQPVESPVPRFSSLSPSGGRSRSMR